MTKKEFSFIPSLGMVVFHDKIYDGREPMKIIGIRETELELEGDYSGGTHAVTQSCWMPIEGAFRLRKVCEQHENGKPCPLENRFCGYPDCEPYLELWPDSIYPTRGK